MNIAPAAGNLTTRPWYLPPAGVVPLAHNLHPVPGAPLAQLSGRHRDRVQAELGAQSLPTSSRTSAFVLHRPHHATEPPNDRNATAPVGTPLLLHATRPRVLTAGPQVDLAGSERLHKTRSEGSVAKEAQYINKSLSFLEQVILALTEKFRDHIPYRSSKLTHMLRDSLGGNCKTVIVANVWAAPEHLDETISTCKFAARIMRITNAVSVNLREDPDAMLRRYEREIRELRLELAVRGVPLAHLRPLICPCLCTVAARCTSSGRSCGHSLVFSSAGARQRGRGRERGRGERNKCRPSAAERRNAHLRALHRNAAARAQR